MNARPGDRGAVRRACAEGGLPAVAYWFDTRRRDAISRNEGRTASARVPIPAILGTHKRLVAPGPEEGFDEVFRVTPGGAGAFTIESAPPSGPP